MSQVETVRLRVAVREDAEALALVGAATFLEAFTWMLPGPDIVAHCGRVHTAAAYRDYLERPSTRIALLETDGEPGEAGTGAPVGYAMLTQPELPTLAVQPGDVELKRIYLLSRFRGALVSGLLAASRPGQVLMEWAVQGAQEMGGKRLLLGTHAGNERAIAFYRKNGFAVAGTRQFQVGAQICDDYIFARAL